MLCQLFWLHKLLNVLFLWREIERKKILHLHVFKKIIHRFSSLVNVCFLKLWEEKYLVESCWKFCAFLRFWFQFVQWKIENLRKKESLKFEKSYSLFLWKRVKLSTCQILHKLIHVRFITLRNFQFLVDLLPNFYLKKEKR